MSSSVLPVLPITIIGNDVATSLKEFCSGKIGVIDLWHTKCIKCPAALEKLNEEASEHTEFLYIAAALSLGPGNKDAVSDLISE